MRCVLFVALLLAPYALAAAEYDDEVLNLGEARPWLQRLVYRAILKPLTKIALREQTRRR
jgi:hypothetical protein